MFISRSSASMYSRLLIFCTERSGVEKSGPLAHLVEQRTFNPLVLGSSPRRLTNLFPNRHPLPKSQANLLLFPHCRSVSSLYVPRILVFNNTCATAHAGPFRRPCIPLSLFVATCVPGWTLWEVAPPRLSRPDVEVTP